MNSWSLLLGLAVVNAFALAIPLWRSRTNRTANRMLTALMIVVALRLMPYVLGYAGMYDRYSWLTFAPLDLTFAVGPLLWGYVVTLLTGVPPLRWRVHFLPAALQFAYFAACFALPTPAKWNWYTTGHLRTVEPIMLGAVLVSLAVYLLLATQWYRAYARWLTHELSTIGVESLTWLRNVLYAFSITVALAVAFAVTGWFVTPLDYFERFPVIVWLAALSWFLGFTGLRHGGNVLRLRAEDAVEPAARLPRASADYPSQALAWTALVTEAGWYRDPLLTRALLATHLATSPRTLSRVLNEGTGETFHQCINRLRVEAVCRELADPGASRDVLTVALDAGFASKASFNRAFKQVTGVTPTAWRLKSRQLGADARVATHDEGAPDTMR